MVATTFMFLRARTRTWRTFLFLLEPGTWARAKEQSRLLVREGILMPGHPNERVERPRMREPSGEEEACVGTMGNLRTRCLPRDDLRLMIRTRVEMLQSYDGPTREKVGEGPVGGESRR
jgi:hypothetical protein